MKGTYFLENFYQHFVFFFKADKKFPKCLESWKKDGCNFFFKMYKKFRKCLESWKNTNVKFSLKSEQKIIRHKFLSYRGPYSPFSQGTLFPTPLSGASVPRPWMKNNRLKPKSTGSRVLLVNVSESGPISEFSTFFLLRFWNKFHRRLFYDSNHFLTLYPLWRKKNCVRKISTSKKFSFSEAHNFLWKS